MANGFFAEKSLRFSRLRASYVPFRAARLTWTKHLALAAGSLLAVNGLMARPQVRSAAELPDAPVPKSDFAEPQQDLQQAPHRAGSTGLLSRRSVFFPELAYQQGPLSTGQKLALAVGVSVAPSRFISSGFIAGINQATNTPSGYGQGGEAYGKRFGASMAASVSENVFGVFLLPTIFHQDPRHFVRPNLSFKQRVGYALRRVVVTRTDSGGEAFNVSGILGALMAESLANSYLPDAERTAGRTFQRSGIRIGVAAANSIVREWWPSIFKSLRRRRTAQNSGGTGDSGIGAKP